MLEPGIQKHLKNLHMPVSPIGQQPFRLVADLNLTDDAIWTRIQGVWWLVNEDIAIHKFPSHLEANSSRMDSSCPKPTKMSTLPGKSLSFWESIFGRNSDFEFKSLPTLV